MAEILPRFHRFQQQLEDEKRIAKLILETGGSVEEAGGKISRGADGHNWERRRGLPLISRGVGGAMRGTNPLGALIAKEDKQRRR